jgi:predicted AlkP superfamily phosphohydrolase/phosphomutase
VRLQRSVQVANFETHDAPESFSTWPPSVADGLGPAAGVNCDELAVAGRHAELVDVLERNVALKGDLLVGLAGEARDALVAVFGASHCVGHQCWHQPDAVVSVYEAIDRQVGRLLERVPDADIVLHLSHGMSSHSGCSQIIKPVVRRISDAVAAPGAVLAFVERYRQGARYHRNRWQLRAGVGGDRQLVGLVESSRAAEVIPNNDAHAGIRFNVRGREPRGRIEPSDLPAVRAALVRHLLDVRDLDAGVPLVAEVLDTDDLYPGARRPALPDLLVLFHPEARGERVASPVIDQIEMPYRGNRTGDHLPGGLLAVRTARTSPSTGGGHAVRTVDIAPTIAALLGASLRSTEGAPMAGGKIV